MAQEFIEKAKKHFERIILEQIERVEKMKQKQEWVDYKKLPCIRIGIVHGDGIGPYISRHTERVLKFLLEKEYKEGKVEFKVIEGVTIENRVKHNKAIPDDAMEEIRQCPVILKGPTTTPRQGDPWPNIESANVAMRRYLDLFANVRPVRIPKEKINWVFFRENTEGAYVLGSQGINVTDDLAIDFNVTTTQGSERIIRYAFEYAKRNKIDRVTAVTKANVIKTCDGKFLDVFYKIAKEYPEINADDWYIDIMTAKLIDVKRRSEFKVMVLPNLYGDIITDEAAEMQGGVGTAGAANVGYRYAMFEAIHGSAPRMVAEGRADYADPSSLMRAAAYLLNHIGYPDRAEQLEMALDICGQFEKKLVITGRPTGAKAEDFTDYLIETMKDPNLKTKWENFQK